MTQASHARRVPGKAISRNSLRLRGIAVGPAPLIRAPSGRDCVGQTGQVAVRRWREHGPAVMPLPHPSPANNRWLARHPWFEQDVVPALRARVAGILARAG